MRVLCLFLLLSLSSVYAQVWQGSTINPPYRLNSVDYSGDIGYAVGESGVVFKSTDFGRSWNLMRTGQPTEWLNSVDIHGSDIWAVGENGLIIKSTNAGGTWSYIVLNTTENLQEIYFSSDVGYIAGYNSTLHKTTNSGGTWTKVNFNSSSYQITSVRFGTDLFGALSTSGVNGQILVTENGGAGFLPLTVPNIGAIFSLAVPNDNVIYAAGETGFIKSTNRGLTWQNLTLNLPGYIYGADLFFYDTQNGIVVTNSGMVYRTTNGGASWTYETVFTTGTGTALAFYSNDLEHINIIGYGQKQSWYRNPPIQISIDSSSAYVRDTLKVAVRVSFPSAYRAFSFQLYTSGYANRLNFLYAKPTTGTLISSAGWGFFSNTIDNKLRFIAYGSDSIWNNGILTYLYFKTPDTLNASTDSLTIVIDSAYFNTGDYPVVLKNGKVTLKQKTPGDVDLNGLIQAYDASLILRHLVGGIVLNQDQLMNAEVTNDNTLSALDASTIARYVAGLIPTLPWSGNFFAAGTPEMNDINIQSGQIFSVPVYLLQSTNILSFEGKLNYDEELFDFIGLEFSSQFTGSIKDYNQTTGSVLFALSALTGSEVISSEPVLKLKLRLKANASFAGSSVVGLQSLRLNENTQLVNSARTRLFLVTSIDKDNEKPVEYSLQQNYPNPFNPSTRITFGLKDKAAVYLAVFNQLGEQITLLASGDYNAGMHEVIWNATGQTSGIYFCKMVTEKFSSVKKLILIK